MRVSCSLPLTRKYVVENTLFWFTGENYYQQVVSFWEEQAAQTIPLWVEIHLLISLELHKEKQEQLHSLWAHAAKTTGIPTAETPGKA